MSTEKHVASDRTQVKLMSNILSNSQSRTIAIDVLKDAVGKCQDNTIAALTENDYEQLIVLLGELTDVVRADENHLLAPLYESHRGYGALP